MWMTSWSLTAMVSTQWCYGSVVVKQQILISSSYSDIAYFLWLWINQKQQQRSVFSRSSTYCLLSQRYSYTIITVLSLVTTTTPGCYHWRYKGLVSIKHCHGLIFYLLRTVTNSSYAWSVSGITWKCSRDWNEAMILPGWRRPNRANVPFCVLHVHNQELTYLMAGTRHEKIMHKPILGPTNLLSDW